MRHSDHDAPMTPDERNRLYVRLTMGYIRQYKRWVKAGKPRDSADAPEPPDPVAWAESQHPEIRGRLLAEFVPQFIPQTPGPASPSKLNERWLASIDAFAIETNSKSGEEKVLGRGGMGEVLAAVDRVFDRPVAIKFLLVGRDDPAVVERFFGEAKLLALLR